MSFKNRVYLSRIVCGAGDWMTLLVVSLWINETFGSQWVPISFLISSVPHLLLSRRFTQWTASYNPKHIFLVSQVLLALNVAALAISQTSLSRVYLFVGIAAVINALSRPTWDSLLGLWFDGEDRQEVFLRVGSINASLLILAPVSGGVIAQFFGYHWAFILDSFSFLLGTLVILPELMAHGQIAKGQRIDRSNFIFASEKQMSANLLKPVLAWYVLLILGAFINGTEYLVFKRFQYSPSEIGFILACWGLGGLLSLSYAKQIRTTPFSRGFPLVLSFALAGFFISNSFYFSCLAFVLAGFLNSAIGGTLRARIQNQIDDLMQSRSVWALLNQRLSLINIFGYFLCSAVLAHLALPIVSCIFIVAGFLLHFFWRSMQIAK